MLVKSLISKIKTQKPITYYCKVCERIAIISQHNGKDGLFYLVINFRNEVFSMKKSELEHFTWIEPITPFNVNQTPLFEDYILEKFTL